MLSSFSRENSLGNENSLAHISFNFCYLDLKFCMQFSLAIDIELRKNDGDRIQEYLKSVIIP